MKNLLIFLLIFLFGCEYTPIYKSNNSNDIKIEILEMQGDDKINQLIKNELKIYSKDESQKKYEIIIKTDFGKSTISKDASGTITNYQIFVKANFEIKYKNKIENVSFEERFNIKKTSNTFEQKKYENTIILNFAESIKDKLILKLLSL